MSRKFAFTAVLITIITLLSKFVGFIREVALAAKYGATIHSDAFIMAQSIIGVFTGLVLAALGTTFIPVMSDYIQHKSKEETNKFLNVVYTVTTGITIIMAALGFVFAQQIVRVFAPNYSAEAFSLTVQLTLIMLPVVVLMAIVTLESALLQNHGSYLVPAAIGLPLNLAMIATMLTMTDVHGIHGLAAAYVVGTLLQIAFMYPFSRKLGYRFKLDFDMREEGLRRIGVLIVPIMIGSGLQQINTIVDRMLASGLPEGSIAALNFSNRLNLFIIGFISAAVVSIYYTSMSNYFSAGESEKFKKLLRNTINVSTLFIIPATAGFLVLRLPIVRLIFERGKFDSTASEMTAVALFYYTFGLIGFLLRDVLSRAFYAIKDTKTAMLNGAIAVVLNIVFSLILVRYLGLGGLALGTSISGVAGTVLLIYSLRKKIGDFGIRNITATFIKVIVASCVMGIIVLYVYDRISIWTSSNILAVTVSILTGLVIYGILVSFMKIEEFDSLKQAVRNRLKAIKVRQQG
jgi:putative peptidoglycan lipid II flippase